MFNHKRDFIGTDFQDSSRPFASCTWIPEPRVEKSGIVDSKLPDQRVISDHFGRVCRRNLHGFLRCQNIKVLRIQHQSAAARRVDRLPVIKYVIILNLINID